MRGKTLVLCFVLIVALVFVQPLSSQLHAQAPGVRQTLHAHVRPAVTSGEAKLVGIVPRGQTMRLSIVLPLRNQEALTSLLTRLYDPSSPDYRRFLSVDQFTQQFGPTQADYQAVVSFAQSHGFAITSTPANRLLVPISGTVEQVESAFHVTMNLYQHPSEDRTFFSPDREPSLDLQVPVRHISGLNNFSIPHPMVVRNQAGINQAGILAATVTGSGPGSSYLGSDMRAAYYGGTTLDGNGQSLGLFEFGGYNINDVNATFTNAGQSYNVAINNVLLDGATGAAGEDDSEQVLDIVQAIGMAPGLSQVRVYIGSVGTTVDDASILNSMASENIAKQLSCSWGWLPEDPGTDDVFFQEFAAQGQSFFASSGDSGAFDAAISPFFYPQEDANVTAVGGTHLTTNGPGGAWASEVAWNSEGYGSGGGVSPDAIPIASWQAGVATSANEGSTTLRNVPDVAMEGDFDNYACANGGCFTDFAGTSFAAPRWAGFMALVNQQAVEAGTAPSGGIGFLNPILYSIGSGARYSDDMHDIASGNNDTKGQPVWYSAVSGYDLVTGWGSATGQDLIDDLAGKQVPGFWIAASSPAVSLLQGGSASTTISITDAEGFTGNVTLALTSALPSGVTASWSTNPTSGSSVLTLKASASAPASTTTLTLTGTSGKLTAITNVAVVVHGPTFAISSSSGSLQVKPNGSTTTTVTVTPEYGFTGNVTLAVSGLPSGVTASFSPNPTSGTTTLTVNAGASAAAATSTLTITGTSGSLIVTTIIPLNVVAPTFTLSNPGNMTLGQGSSNTAYIYVNALNGFTGSVNLSVSGLPSGVTASFSPNPSTGQSIMTLTASSSTPLGASMLTVTGTSGSLSATTTFSLGIFAQTFTVLSPGNVTIGQGTSSTVSLYVNPEYGFTGSVNLAVSGLPSGVTASVSPNPTTGAATLTLTASSAAALGATTVTITGTSGKLTASATFPLTVATPTFTLSASNLDLGQGTSGVSYIYITPVNGFTGSVNLVASGLPSGVTASFVRNPTTDEANITLTASGSAMLGTKTITITGTSGTQTVTSTFALNVHTPTFTISGPANVTLGPGTSGASNVYIVPQYGFAGSVSLTASGLPSGVTASFTPNPTTGEAAITLTASNSAALGTKTITITGTSGTQTASATFSFSVLAPAFTLSSPGNVTVGQGTSTTSYINVYPENGFNSSVNLAVSGLPTGVTASLTPNPTTGEAAITLTASNSAALGTKTITITGTSGSQTATTTFSLGVFAPTFTLSVPTPLSIGQASSITNYIYINPEYGFTGNVSFAVSGLPSGVTASFSPNPTTGSTALTLTATSTASVGQYNITITGTSGTQSVSTAASLGVYAPTFTLSNFGNVSLDQGSSGTTSVYIYPQYGFTGNVSFSVSGLPSGVTASFSPNPATGNTVLTLTAGASAALGTSTLTITGKSGTQTATTTLPLGVYAPSFSLSAGSLSIGQGSSGSTYIFVNTNTGFNSNVTLAVSGLPSGVTASFSPNPTVNGSSTVTFNASNSASLGQYNVTITGTLGKVTASTLLPVTIYAPAFTLYSQGGVNIGQGTSATSYVSVNPQYGFTGSVHFAVTGLPSGVTASFSPNPTTNSTTLTLTASSTATLGEYNATITGTSGSQTASTTFQAAVYSPTFTLYSPGISIGQGSSITSYVSVSSQYGFTGNVNFAVTGLPSGVTAAFSSNPSTGTTLTLTASSTAALGQYNAMITGTSGKITATTPLNISIYAPTFTLNSYWNLILGRGMSTTSSVYISPAYGFTGNVTLAASGLPSGVTASFSPNPTNGSSTLTLTASSTAVLGQYNITILGTSGSQSASTILTLGVYVPSFTLSNYGGGGTLGQGTSNSTYISINPLNGFNGNVSLAASGLPSGVTASFSPNPTSGSSTLTLTASSTASLGQYNVTITGTSGTLTASTVVPLSIYVPTFTVYSQGSLSLEQGASASTYADISPEYGFTGSVNLAVSGLPAGVTASFAPNPTTANSTLTLTAGSTAPIGQYALTITGTSGTKTTSTPLTLAVMAPVPVSYPVTLSPASLSFPATPTGSVSASQPVVLINPGEIPLLVKSISLAGTNANQFEITQNGCTTTLPAYTSCYLSIAFKPTSSAAATASLLITDNAINSPQTITLSGSGDLPTAAFSPSTLTFPATSVGSTSAPQTITFSNTSSASMSVSSFTFSGANAGEFEIVAKTCTTTLASGATCTLQIAFKPTTTGAASATLTATDNASNSPQIVALSVPPPILAQFSPSSLTFPVTAIGSKSASQTLTFTNTSTSEMSVQSFAIFSSSAFEITGKTCIATLAAGASCILQIAFAPLSAGTATGTLYAADNALNSPQGVTLSGSTPVVNATLSPGSLTFASTAVGAVSAAQTVTFTDPDAFVSLSVKSFAFAGPNANEFEITGKTCTTTLFPHASCTLQIAFKPTATGAASASLVATDSAANSPQAVTLSASTPLSNATLSPGSLSFAETAVGAVSASQTITFTNPGATALSVKSFTFAGSNAGEFEITGKTCSTSLAAGASCTLQIAFKPTATGAATASFAATDGAANSPQTVSLSANTP